MLAGILVMTMSKLYYKGKKVLLCKKTTLHKDPCSEHHSDGVFDQMLKISDSSNFSFLNIKRMEWLIFFLQEKKWN